MEKRPDPQAQESKAKLAEQIKACLQSGEYSRALDFLRGATTEFPNDAELSELEKRAQDGAKRKSEADRLITQSQELFAQQKSAEAIQLLRKAYELDKNNSLARAILANALVEHANSIVETDWLEAEKLSNQALVLNPAHPTAKTIRNLIVDLKQTISVEDWAAKARKLQSSGDLFGALAWVAEGLAVHPDDGKLLQVQHEIQRDQGARRRQTRRRDLDDLRRMELEINASADAAAKQQLATRIQTVAAKYWTDGEFLAIANALLLRLGLVPQKSSSGSVRNKGAAVIFHVPQPSAPEAPREDSRPVPSSPVPPSGVPVDPIAAGRTSVNVSPPSTAVITPPVPELASTPEPAAVSAVEPPAPVVAKAISRPSQPKEATRPKSITLILVSTAAIALVAAIVFFVRRHQTPTVIESSVAVPTSAPAVSAPAVSSPAISALPQATSEPVPAMPAPPPDIPSEKIASDDQPPTESGGNLGAMVVVAGQDGAKVSLNGKMQRQLTQAGQLRIPNLAAKDYIVQISKSGFQDPPQQKVRIRKGEEARLLFNLLPLPHLASLTIQGGAPGAAVLIDQNLVGTIQPDGTFSASTINPGDHTVELRKERFKPRQFKKHFVAGSAISFAGADAALEAAPAELKIAFTPPDARVAIVKGELVTVVNSGAPLSVAGGTYTLTARTADGFTSSSTFEAVAGQSKTLELSLAPNGMSKWEDQTAWKRVKDGFTCKGGNFVLYGVVPASGTFVFSAMPTKGRLQWVLNYTDPKNYVLLQMDDNYFYRAAVRNGQRTDEIKVPDKGDKRSYRTLHIRVSSAEIVHQVKHGNSWTIVDRWKQPGSDLSRGKFGFYVPGDDQVSLSSFAHHADLNLQ